MIEVKEGLKRTVSTFIVVTNTDTQHLPHVQPLHKGSLHTAPGKPSRQPLIPSVSFPAMHPDVSCAVCASTRQVAGVHSHCVLSHFPLLGCRCDSCNCQVQRLWLTLCCTAGMKLQRVTSNLCAVKAHTEHNRSTDDITNAVTVQWHCR